ncbi:MAG: hypothetical protein L0H31_16745, partial [Nocardioidaceae bacterium]|nr:hypothetical protein [Nocardioidaceae bacterium]
MADDFVARLGSRALRPTEIRTAWDVEAYAGLLDPDSEAGRRVDRLTNRGARAIRRVDPARMRAVLTALADPPSAELNHAELARLAGMPATTIGPYVDVLVELGAICLLPATRAPLAKRVVARPR